MFSSWRGAEDPSRTSGPLTKRRSAALSTPPRPRPPPLGGRRARHLAKGRTQPAGRRSLQPTGESYAVPGRKEWRATAKSRAAPQAAQPPRAGGGAASTGGTDLSGRGAAAIGVHRPLSVIDTRWHGERDGGRERDTIRGGPDET